MIDALLVLATFLLGGLALLYVNGCAALLDGDGDER